MKIKIWIYPINLATIGLGVLFMFITSFGEENTINNESTYLQEKIETVTDIDGNVYHTVTIGKQVWMAENLRINHGPDGKPIQSYFYNNDTTHLKIYGRLYSWEEAVKISIDGWRLPTEKDWNILMHYLGGRTVAGGKMKLTGTKYWHPPNSGATNESGFKALPGGFRGPDGKYYALGNHCGFWGVSDSGSEPWCEYLYHDYPNIKGESNTDDKTSGIAFSVRLIKAEKQDKRLSRFDGSKN